ncbi:L-seryl-tRNA(Sec) selenium transferase [Bacillus sp. 31A1R]|uniref:L-seryl-tRNA(Sec) selenium transferase n=1 Tax=Robertmurraya mangrovi TaxID=3098077 RepID=A0ABU5J060_9BACI|nr:L-seryl-tRNA(Sec) selenium transferase [Bacillus sp. 31A1R]MDZ5472756.1 L-seryl-tRNA(Sec) selenium transferase [Bacillus sp. 31A1R]
MKELLRSIPPIHEVQKNEKFIQLLSEYGIDQNQLTNILKEIISEIRESIIKGNWDGAEPGTESFINLLFAKLQSKIDKRFDYTLKRVINCTGTVLHTNLGRARLSENAIKHVVETAQNYSNLEYKLEEGERGSRHTHVEDLIKELTGAEAAMVVNNNAAAVYLILRALAHDKEVIVSRGQLVEIGGSFRISSIMEESGAKLVEVGTTNKTHVKDYVEALSEETAMIMKVHTSNFKILGFTKTVETEELVELSVKHDVIFYEDLGSGVLYDYRKNGIGDEPVVKDVLDMGVNIVSFSGDKLLGGPQAGIIAGNKKLIDQLKKNQLARVVRVDKMTLAALEGTLMDYLKGENGVKNIPVVRDVLATKAELKARVEHFVAALGTETFDTAIQASTSQVGGGTMPEVELPTYVAVLKHKTLSAEKVAYKLRNESEIAVVVRIQKDEIVIDLRTVSKEEECLLVDCLLNIS